MSPPLASLLRNRLRRAVLELRRLYFVKFWGMDIGQSCDVSFTAKLDKTNPSGVHIGDESIVTFGSVILTHDAIHNRSLDTRIGKGCFVGAHSIILPGVTIGDYSIVGAGSVVVEDVPPRCIVAGNPARVIRSEIVKSAYARDIPIAEDELGSG
jgi:acetyltransferase-like isoleucine patch superfamily enzyme